MAAKTPRLTYQRLTNVILPRWIRNIYSVSSAPLAIVFLTYSKKVRKRYDMGWRKRIWLGFRFWRNYYRLESGTSWRAHLVMAMKLLEMPASKKGCVVECGCYKGGATVNLSLVCKIIGRKLKVYDSFRGLPPPSPGDYVAEKAFKKGYTPGVYTGELEEVRRNVQRFGAVEACEFYPGWFEDTLPQHKGKIVLAFWDVDFCSSLHDCLTNLWPHIAHGGYVFMDEYRAIPYCSVFYSEKYWRKYFNTVPPGLIGIGTGVQVGMFYTDPSLGMGSGGRIQAAESIAFTVKGTRAIWEYYPDEEPKNP